MSGSKQRISVTVLMLIAIAALIAGLFVAQHLPSKKAALAEEFKGTLLSQPREIAPFSLTGIDDKPFNRDSLVGHSTLIFFGFTHCGSICPVTMAELAKMYRLLEQDGVTSLPQVVMISVDPERDSLAQLSAYVKAFNPHFYGARGSSKVVHQLAKELGVVYTKVIEKQGEPTENYNIQHSGAVMLFNSQGQLIAFFTPPLKAADLAGDYELL